MENNWTPDYRETIEETSEDINPMKDLGVVEGDDIHIVEDEKYEEEFEKLLKEEEEISNEIIETPSGIPTLKKSKQNTLKTSKLNLNRSTGGSRLSRLIGKDNDIVL